MCYFPFHTGVSSEFWLKAMDRIVCPLIWEVVMKPVMNLWMLLDQIEGSWKI